MMTPFLCSVTLTPNWNTIWSQGNTELPLDMLLYGIIALAIAMITLHLWNWKINKMNIY
jgi:hypothetical protein